MANFLKNSKSKSCFGLKDRTGVLAGESHLEKNLHNFRGFKKQNLGIHSKENKSVLLVSHYQHRIECDRMQQICQLLAEK